jgi:hypothetical protein
VLQQLGGLWRWVQEQSPARQALIFATPVVGAALLVLFGLIAWTLIGSFGTPRAPTVSQASPAAVQATNPPPARNATQSPPAQNGTQAPPVAAKPTVIVPPSPTPAPPTATPTSSPTPTPTPVPARSAKIVDTDGQGAIMRKTASVSAARVKVIPEGTVVELVGSEQKGDGYTWREVRDVDNSTGFVVDEYLQPIQAPPGATAVLPPPSIQVDEMTSPAARGSEATLRIITRPGVRCDVRVLVFGPDALPTDGLQPTTADKDGVCEWRWTVPDSVVPGTWRYRISAGEGEGRATREVSVVIT